jgi:hypothetical protein
MAHVLKSMGARTIAYPFDWLLTNDGDRFIELLERNFENYLEKDSFKLANNILVHSYYHIEYRHEHEGLDQLIAKQARRVERFKELDSYSGKVVFVRIPYSEADNPSLFWPSAKDLIIHEDEAQRLDRALRGIFPHLNYTLLIINHEKKEETKMLGNLIFTSFADMSEGFVPYLNEILKE